MHPSAIQLEMLRQQIESAEDEAGSLSDYLDRGRNCPAPVPDPARRMDQLMEQAKKQKVQLRQQITHTNPQAIEEWVNFHVNALAKIANEPLGNAEAATRKSVARRTIVEWEQVRTGGKAYVSTNWSYLKDHQEHARQHFNRS